MLTHTYDGTGRLTGLSLNGNPLVTGIAWNPLGQPTGVELGVHASPPLAASRSYDTAGRLTATEFSSYAYDAAGRITSLTQNLYQPGDTDPTHSTIANANVTWSVGYSAVGRIVSFNATGNTAGFGYDANGNRSSSTRALEWREHQPHLHGGIDKQPAHGLQPDHQRREQHERHLRLQRQRRPA